MWQGQSVNHAGRGAQSIATCQQAPGSHSTPAMALTESGETEKFERQKNVPVQQFSVRQSFCLHSGRRKGIFTEVGESGWYYRVHFLKFDRAIESWQKGGRHRTDGLEFTGISASNPTQRFHHRAKPKQDNHSRHSNPRCNRSHGPHFESQWSRTGTRRNNQRTKHAESDPILNPVGHGKQKERPAVECEVNPDERRSTANHHR